MTGLFTSTTTSRHFCLDVSILLHPYTAVTLKVSLHALLHMCLHLRGICVLFMCAKWQDKEEEKRIARMQQLVVNDVKTCNLHTVPFAV